MIAARARFPTTPTRINDVGLDPAERNILFRVNGLGNEFRRVLGRKMDVFSAALLKRAADRELPAQQAMLLGKKHGWI
ncbi:hypothetical protein [Streptomyces sp. NBC_01005]|uniref:hypothetical protein n=1 Tax=Streptomyces sp. NBC_01005 TaxID=2903715 RepID=UPI002F9093D2